MSLAAQSFDSKQLLKQAAEWRLLGMLFECPVRGWSHQIAALSDEIESGDLKSAAAFALMQGSEGLYHSVFGPGGPAAPREVSYLNSVQPGSLMSELAGYYAAFAYQPVTGEVADHVSVEIGFIAYLRFKEAFALACGDREAASITSDASGRFVEDHLSVLAEPLATALGNSGIDYLALAAQAFLKRAGRPRNVKTDHNDSPLPDSDCDIDCGIPDAGCAIHEPD